MAKDKGRIVIWSIVGLAVVVVAILFLTAERGDRRPVDVRAFTRIKERTIGRYEREIAVLRDELGPEADSALNKAEQDLVLAREQLGRMQSMTEQKLLRIVRDSVLLNIDLASDILRVID